jgi:hypothetical protein
MPATASGLTRQAGLIPVIKFLQRIGYYKTLNQTVTLAKIKLITFCKLSIFRHRQLIFGVI